MNLGRALGLSVALVGCASTCPSGPAPSIVGVWELRPAPNESYGLNSACHSFVEYRGDGTFVTRNGEMEIVGKYRMGTEEDGSLYYCESDMRGNGAKSCQGLTSDFVIGHTLAKRRASVDGDVLKLYSPLSKRFFAFDRRKDQ